MFAEARELFRLLVVHLKNSSLLRGDDVHYRLSPACDLVSTRLLIDDDR